MASSHLFRLATVKGKNGLLVALKHNKRTLQAEVGATANIDATKSHLNYALTGNFLPETIVAEAKVSMVRAGIDVPRKNQVMAVEVVVSLPINWHKKDTSNFFSDSLAWIKQNFAGELLSFDVHLDESAPHAHALILPLIDGKMQGSHMMGGKGNLMRLINKFHAEVAINFGLSRSDKKGLNFKDKQMLAKKVLAGLKSDCVMQSAVYAIVRDQIFKDPMPFAQILSITLEKTVKLKSFVDYKRSRGKGDFVK